MNSLLKMLVGSACCVTIAAGAVYASGLYSAHVDRVERVATIQSARKHLRTEATRHAGEHYSIDNFCMYLVATRDGSAYTKSLLRDCRNFGHL